MCQRRPGAVLCAAMTDSEDLARRWLALWEDYLAALWADPSVVEMVRRWLPAVAPGDDGVAPRQSGPPPRAAAAAGASGERGDAVAELARRLDRLERRVA